MDIKEEIKKLVPDEKTYHQVLALCYQYTIQEFVKLRDKLVKEEEKE